MDDKKDDLQVNLTVETPVAAPVVVPAFLDRLKKAALELITSKKAIAAFAGVLVSLFAKNGLNIPEQTVMEILSLIAAYIVGQGIADAGKPKV